MTASAAATGVADARSGVTRYATASPVLLEDGQVLTVVLEGRLDVYLIPAGGGPETGPRFYQFSVDPGAGTLGAPAAGGMALVAVPVGGTVVQHTPRPVLELAEWVTSRGLAAGVLAQLGRAAAEMAPARVTHELLPDASAVVAADATVGVRHEVVWARVSAGTLTLFDAPNAVVPAGGELALAPGLWARAREAGIVATAAAPSNAATGWTTVAATVAAFVRWRAGQLTAEAGAYQARHAIQLELEAQLTRRGIAQLAGLLVNDELDVDPELGDPGSPLLTAMRLVARPLGVTLRPAPQWERELGLRDPIAAICRASRVRYRQVGLRGAWWRADAGPLLAFTRDVRDPVALLYGQGAYERVSPATGERAPVTAQAAQALEPMGFALYRPLPNVVMGGVDLLRFALAPVRADLRRVVLFGAVTALIGLTVPVATRFLLTDLVPTDSRNGAAMLALTLVALQLGSATFDAARAFALVRIDGKSSVALQAAVVDRLLSLPVPFFRRFNVGDLASRAMAVNAVRDLLSGVAVTSLISGIFAVAYLLQMLIFSWRLALVALVVVAIVAAVTTVAARAAARHQRAQQEVSGRLGGLVVQMIGAVPKLRVAGAEPRAFAVWCERFGEQKRLAWRGVGAENAVQVANAVLPLLASALLFAIAGWTRNESYALTPAEFIAFNAAFGTFFAAVAACSNTVLTVISAIPLAERARPILEALPETSGDRADPRELTGHVSGAHLTFRYREDGPAIVDDVSFEARPGEFIAFVGPSGSGKSTILRLLLGFEEPAAGAVSYDGQNLSTIDVTAVRAQLGVVLQSSRLSSGNIFDNIVGSAPLSEDDAWEAAEAAGLADDITAMPMQMRTVVSEGGSTLSGGQRQRLLIARALVRKPRIVLLDEATSALDNRAQEVVGRSLARMRMTRIVIAHRLSTVRNADRIYVVQGGRVVQQGTNDALLAERGGLFEQLVRRQMA